MKQLNTPLIELLSKFDKEIESLFVSKFDKEIESLFVSLFVRIQELNERLQVLEKIEETKRIIKSYQELGESNYD